MKEKSEIRFFWDNPFDGSGTIERIIGNRKYTRKVEPQDFISPVEATKVLGYSLVHVHRLNKTGKLKGKQTKNGTILFRLRDVTDYQRDKRPSGRPSREPFLNH